MDTVEQAVVDGYPQWLGRDPTDEIPLIVCLTELLPLC